MFLQFIKCIRSYGMKRCKLFYTLIQLLIVMIKRIFMFVSGLFLMSLGVGFSIVSTLGTTPISSISYALALITDINIGITTFIFNSALILIQIIILRSEFKKKRLLQFINCFLFGYFTDLSLYLLSFIPYENSVFIYIIFLFISIFLIAFGIFVYMPANIAPLPGEGCVEALSIAFNWRFSTVKICFDWTMVAVSLIMCGLFYTNLFGAVGIGTVISAFLVGFTLRKISDLYVRVTGREMNIVNRD